MVPVATRKSWRQAYGDLPALIAAAKDERDRGQLENAYTAYRLALGQWLRAKWVEQSGKANSPLTDPEGLADKLRQAGKIDRWLAGMLKGTHHQPCPVEWPHVDVLGVLIESLTQEGRPCK